jgi:AAHS family 4-hydroxybenzoate transporter-like MFS transporter
LCWGRATAYFPPRGQCRPDTNLFIAGIGLHGLFVNAVQCSLYALCAFVYPTLVRATGTASALAFGRLGAILSSFAGAAVITAGGAHAYLTLLGSAMVVTLVAMLVVRRHIPQVGSVRMAPVATVASH